MEGHDPAGVSPASRAPSSPLEAEPQISSQLVRMIDFFFALVLGQGLLRFDAVVKDPVEANIQVLLALVLIYYTVIRSFINWHISLEIAYYRIVSNEKRTELARIFMDVLIVVLYSYMLFAVEPLKDDPGGDIEAMLLAFPILFFLYLGWEALRRRAWIEDDEAPMWVLAGFAVLYGALLLAYRGLPSGIDPVTKNTVFLMAALGLMAAYRVFGSTRVSGEGH